MTTSWDDGHPLDLRIADLLAKYGLSGTFYAPRSAETATMPQVDLRALGQHFEIGAHTLRHCVLTETDAREARDEIAGSKRWIEDVTGKPCRMFCPPKGKYAPAHAEMVRKAGFTGLRTVELGSLDFPRSHAGLAVQPTSVQAHPHGVMSYARNAAARGAPGNLWRCILHGGSRDWTRLAKSLLVEVVAHGGVFHLWGHAWEIEACGQWDRLTVLLTIMSEHTQHVAPLTNGEICARGADLDRSAPQAAAA